MSVAGIAPSPICASPSIHQVKPPPAQLISLNLTSLSLEDRFRPLIDVSVRWCEGTQTRISFRIGITRSQPSNGDKLFLSGPGPRVAPCRCRNRPGGRARYALLAERHLLYCVLCKTIVAPLSALPKRSFLSTRGGYIRVRLYVSISRLRLSSAFASEPEEGDSRKELGLPARTHACMQQGKKAPITKMN